MAHHHHHASTWTERTGNRDYSSLGNETPVSNDLEYHARNLGFKSPDKTFGILGSIVHMGSMLFPVLAAELIPDPAKYKKAVRIAAIATTVVYAGLHTGREIKRQHEQAARLAECQAHEK
jgi:hypothetical protein